MKYLPLKEMNNVNGVQILDEAVSISHTLSLYSWERHESNYSPSSYG